MRAYFYGVAIGVDRLWVLDEDNKLITGVFGAYDGAYFDLRRDNSRAEGQGFGGGAYATWAERSGWYADALVKVSALHQDLRSDGVESDLSNVGIGAYLDAGKRFDLANDWYVEPFAAFTYAHMTGYSYLVSVDAANLYQVRAGASVGKRFDEVTVYAKAAAAEQFSSAGSLTDGVNTWKPNSNGFRVECALGAVWQISENNTLNASYNTSFGKKYTQSWGVNAGFSHRF
jgi:outer membrane autotransporter protein